MSELDPRINFRSCTFDLEKYKNSCGRIVTYNNTNIKNIYTLESSFFGYRNLVIDSI